MKETNPFLDKEFIKTLDTVVAGLQDMTAKLPAMIQQVNKDLSPEDVKKIKDALKFSDYKNVLAEVTKEKKKFDAYMKNINK